MQGRLREADCGLRFGLTVTKRVGHATERNRIKRRLRTVCQKAGLDFRHVDADIVIIGRRDILTADYDLLIDDLRRALRVVTKPKRTQLKSTQLESTRPEAALLLLTSHQRRASRTIPMRNENKNLIVAIALSMAILIGWQYFFAAPEAERHRHGPAAIGAGQSERAQPTRDPEPGRRAVGPVPGTVPASPAATTVESREAALARSPRVAIDTPAIRGSINLRGGRIDDVSLKTYHETVDPKSPNIVLFSPSGTQNPYYAEFGWVGARAGRAAGRQHLVDCRQGYPHALEPGDDDLG